MTDNTPAYLKDAQARLQEATLRSFHVVYREDDCLLEADVRAVLNEKDRLAAYSAELREAGDELEAEISCWCSLGSFDVACPSCKASRRWTALTGPTEEADRDR